jgi:two-component system nitrogen regulation response regulator NtrX
VDDLPPEIIEGNVFARAWNSKSAKITTMPIKEAREAFEKDYLKSQLKRFNWHISQTAKFIGMDRTSLHRKLKTIGLSIEDCDDACEQEIEEDFS